MKKINKIINITLVFILIVVLFSTPELSFADASLLRMPLLFNAKDKKLTESEQAEKELESLIENCQKLGSIKEKARRLKITSILVSLTKYCNSRCMHCVVNSLLLPKDGRILPENIMSDETLAKALDFINKTRPKMLMFSGQGEPFLEFNKLLYLVENSEVLEQIDIGSNGKWADTMENVERYISQIDKAVQARRNHGKRQVKIFIDISVDQFHQKSVPPQNILNILEFMHKAKLAGQLKYFELRLQTLEPGAGLEDTAGILLAKLKPQIKKIEHVVQRQSVCVLNDGFKLGIEVRKLEFSGKGRNLAKRLPQYQRIDMIDLMSRYPLTIAGKDDELDIMIDSGGESTVWEIGDKVFSIGNINSSSVENIKMRATSDPIIRALREKGISYVFNIASKIDPGIKRRVKDQRNNDFTALIKELLVPSQFRLLLSKRILLDYVTYGYGYFSDREILMLGPLLKPGRKLAFNACLVNL